MPDAHDAIFQAIARIPSGCAILTAATPTARTGMLASWVQQAGFDPPSVSVALRKGRPIESLIESARRFALNLIGENPGPMFRHFGRGFSLEQDAFAGLEYKDTPGGVALADSIAVLDCEVSGRLDAGDHWLYVGRVTAAEIRGTGGPYVHLRKSAANY